MSTLTPAQIAAGQDAPRMIADTDKLRLRWDAPTTTESGHAYADLHLERRDAQWEWEDIDVERVDLHPLDAMQDPPRYLRAERRILDRHDVTDAEQAQHPVEGGMWKSPRLGWITVWRPLR